MSGLILLTALIVPGDVTPLPVHWHGVWKGMLEIKSPGKPATEVPFELHIKPMDDAARVTWHVIYGEGAKKSTRPYELVSVPRQVNRFELDEKSGIRMQMCLQDDTLYCLFKTGSSFLQVKYELKVKQETILYEITTFAEKDPLNTAVEKNTKLSVDSYRLLGVQSAVLRLQRPSNPDANPK